MKKNWWLIFIVLISIVFRFWDFGKVPVSPDWDEVALGYNAYSILKTGKDEFGQKFPLIMRSFDDYKPPLYAYLSIPSISVFGLNTVAVRIPSALFGVLTVIAVYFLTKEIFSLDNKKDRSFVENIALLTSFFLAISPWHIQFSRVAFEANVSLSFTVFGLVFFLKAFKKNWLFIPSFVFFTLTFYTYQSAKVLTPLFVLILIFVFRDYLWKIRTRFLIYLSIFTVLSFPFFWTTFTTPNALLRAKGVSVFSDTTPFLERSVERLVRDKENNDKIGFIFDNRRLSYAFAFFNGYLSHFDLKWLFLTGDLARYQPPNFGHLYLFGLPFFLTGIYALAFGNFSKKIKLLIFLWVLLVPIPASIARDVPNGVRTLNFLPFFQIFIALGVISSLNLIKSLRVNKMIKFTILGVYACFSVFNFIYYLDQYFVQYNYFSSSDWQYGYEQAVSYANKNSQNYEKLIISNEEPLEQSYMFFLFFSKYDPKTYLSEGGTVSGGFAEEHHFGSYFFKPIMKDEKDKNTLYVGVPGNFDSDDFIIQTIKSPSGENIIKIGEKN